eukprot:GILJ01005887.1.p1 GENE.GILJ01005887.1~~GILJ01005887.1.p1  ORF type:complete len:853 (+),score=119.33 GILJ01005887.1:45-2603(+)
MENSVVMCSIDSLSGLDSGAINQDVSSAIILTIQDVVSRMRADLEYTFIHRQKAYRIVDRVERYCDELKHMSQRAIITTPKQISQMEGMREQANAISQSIHDCSGDNWLLTVLREDPRGMAIRRAFRAFAQHAKDRRIFLHDNEEQYVAEDQQDDIEDIAHVIAQLEFIVNSADPEQHEWLLPFVSETHSAASLVASIEEQLKAAKGTPSSSLSESRKSSLNRSGPAFREIFFTDLRFSKRIGAGAFGEVFVGDFVGTEVAIKKVLIDGMGGEEEVKMRESFQKEIQLAASLRHPNIVTVIGASVSPPHPLCLVMEFVRGGSLHSVLRTKYPSGMPLPLLFNIARQTVQGMSYLHHCKVVHRDLKPLNVLVDKSMNVKITDFGLSKARDTKTKGNQSTQAIVGTPAWMAPEIFRGEGCSYQSDVYAFGIMLNEMVTGQQPFAEAENAVQIIMKVASYNQRPTMSPTCHPLLTALIQRCWHAEPEQRPSFMQIKEALDDLVSELQIDLDAEQRPDIRHPSLPSTEPGSLNYSITSSIPVNISTTFNSQYTQKPALPPSGYNNRSPTQAVPGQYEPQYNQNQNQNQNRSTAVPISQNVDMLPQYQQLNQSIPAFGSSQYSGQAMVGANGVMYTQVVEHKLQSLQPLRQSMADVFKGVGMGLFATPVCVFWMFDKKNSLLFRLGCAIGHFLLWMIMGGVVIGVYNNSMETLHSQQSKPPSDPNQTYACDTNILTPSQMPACESGRTAAYERDIRSLLQEGMGISIPLLAIGGLCVLFFGYRVWNAMTYGSTAAGSRIYPSHMVLPTTDRDPSRHSTRDPLNGTMFTATHTDSFNATNVSQKPVTVETHPHPQYQH